VTEPMVSAGEAARRLGVAPATIQRWVDSGVLHAERTAGGHRRIYVTELRRLIAANRPAEVDGPLSDWLHVLMSGDPRNVKAALIAARQLSGCWAETADTVASAIAEIGRRWEAGTCQVFEEHAASEALRRGAAICAAEIPCPDDAPRVVLFTVEGERHTLGLSLAELVFAEAGWRVLWLGEGAPADELKSLVAQLKPDLLAVAASSASPPDAIARYQEKLRRIAARARLPLVLAGSGLWAAAPKAHRIVTFRELRSLLARLRKRARTRRAA
jgi:excisionase family DNA binding protein